MFAHLIQFEVSDGLDLAPWDGGGPRYLGFGLEQLQPALDSVLQGLRRTSGGHFRRSVEGVVEEEQRVDKSRLQGRFWSH